MLGIPAATRFAQVHMPRKPRIHLPGGFYHVILRGNGRQAIFFDSTDRQTWEDLLRVSLHRHQNRLHAYCWMTNHIHMAVQAGTAPLAKFMSHLAKCSYAQNIRWTTQKPAWEFRGLFAYLEISQQSLELPHHGIGEQHAVVIVTGSLGGFAVQVGELETIAGIDRDAHA